MRLFEILRESVTPGELEAFIELANECNTVEEFIQRTDGMTVLYRGHYEDNIDNNTFMTDYVGHAAEYAGDNGRIDAFVFDQNDVFFYNDLRFLYMQFEYTSLTNRELAAIYRPSLAAGRFANAMIEGGLKSGKQVLAIVREILDAGDSIKYSDISTNSLKNDLLIPLLQKYAFDKYGKSIIAFTGGDYYGEQNEFVVSDLSKLVNLRELYEKVKNKK